MSGSARLPWASFSSPSTWVRASVATSSDFPAAPPLPAPSSACARALPARSALVAASAISETRPEAAPAPRQGEERRRRAPRVLLDALPTTLGTRAVRGKARDNDNFRWLRCSPKRRRQEPANRGYDRSSEAPVPMLRRPNSNLPTGQGGVPSPGPLRDLTANPVPLYGQGLPHSPPQSLVISPSAVSRRLFEQCSGRQTSTPPLRA